jgi:hypothetical protein
MNGIFALSIRNNPMTFKRKALICYFKITQSISLFLGNFNANTNAIPNIPTKRYQDKISGNFYANTYGFPNGPITR